MKFIAQLLVDETVAPNYEVAIQQIVSTLEFSDTDYSVENKLLDFDDFLKLFFKNDKNANPLAIRK